MNIGFSTPVDIRSFVPFFKDTKSIKILNTCCLEWHATAVETLILSILKDGHHVKLFTLAKADFKLKGNGIEIFCVKINNSYPIRYLWGDFIDAHNLRKTIVENYEGLNVFHAHWTYTFAYAVMPLSKTLPVYCTVRDWTPYIWKIESLKNKIIWSFRIVMNELVFQNKSIHFIANSFYTASMIKKKYNIDVPVIPNPIKASFLTTTDHINPNDLDLLCISSSNDRRKNIKTLLLAFHKLLDYYPSASLTLIGPPFNKEEGIIQQWQKEGLLNKVILKGAVKHNQLINYLDKSRIFVTPSLEETFGNTLLEAMARKVPIVAGKDSGAIPYVLKEGKTGFLCDVSSVNEIIQTIRYVYENKEAAKQTTNEAFNTLNEEYLESKIMKRHLEIYQKQEITEIKDYN